VYRIQTELSQRQVCYNDRLKRALLLASFGYYPVTIKIEVAYFSEMSANSYRTAQNIKGFVVTAVNASDP
jgi:hypothetical protein